MLSAGGINGGPADVAFRGQRVYVSGSRFACTFICTTGGAVARLRPSGALDRSFGTRGYAMAPFQLMSGGGIDFHGKRLVVAGTGRGRGSDLAVARFTG
jgi:hypothetical protein